MHGCKGRGAVRKQDIYCKISVLSKVVVLLKASLYIAATKKYSPKLMRPATLVARSNEALEARRRIIERQGDQKSTIDVIHHTETRHFQYSSLAYTQWKTADSFSMIMMSATFLTRDKNRFFASAMRCSSQLEADVLANFIYKQ